MAIVKIGIMQPLTPAKYDWDKLLGHVLAFNKQVNGLQFPVSGSVIKKSSYIQHGGVLYQVQTSDYTIQGSLTGGVFNYVKIEASGELLVATWITDISAYEWSNEYNCLLAGDESSLLASTERDGVLYRLEKDKVIYTSYETNQDTKTTNDVEFKGLTINGYAFKFRKVPTSIIVDSFASPSSGVSCLTFDGVNLISGDIDSNKIYIHDGISSIILDSFTSPSTPSSSVSGLAFDGVNLISCDYDSDMIYIHDGISSTILDSFPSPSTGIQGLTFDGSNLISCDADTDTIYIHDGISSTILNSFTTPDVGTNGLAFDGVNLISGDSVSNKIYLHNGISSTILDSFASPGNHTHGLTFRDTNLISCDSDLDKISVHEVDVKISI